MISAGIIVAASEISKKLPSIGGILISLPLTSLLAIIWLYVDTKSTQKVVELSYTVFWMVIPSLALFIALPLLLKKMQFFPALAIACSITVLLYKLTAVLIKKFNIIL
jgi:hypothetical protein